MSDSEQGETMTVQEERTASSTEASSESSQDSTAESSDSSSAESSGDSVADAAADSASTDSAAADPASADSDSGGSDSGDSDSADDPADASGKAPRSRRGSVRDLEEEGEVAADYLEELLDIVDVDGDIDIDVENGRASLAIVAEGGSDRSLRRLVGHNGEVLEALQELTRLAVQASTGERSRLMLDVAGHRASRRKVLTEKATKACESVKSSGESVKMEPMTAFERKIVHDVVADAGLESESEGADPNRYVVVLPASS